MSRSIRASWCMSIESVRTTAVRSAAIDLSRSAQRRTAREECFEQETSDASLFDIAVGQREDAEMIETALRRLPPEQREVLTLRIWGELTFAQIAEVLGESINTVAARHRYALQALRHILKPAAHE